MNNFPSYIFNDSSVFSYFSVTPTNLYCCFCFVFLCDSWSKYFDWLKKQSLNDIRIYINLIGILLLWLTGYNKNVNFLFQGVWTITCHLKIEKEQNYIPVLGMLYRSSRPDVFCKKDVLRNFGKFTGKHLLCQSLYYNKVADQSCNFIKYRLWHRCFPVNFIKFLRTHFFREQLR